MNVMDILCRIERGEISVQDGISLINESRGISKLPSGKGRFMKIKVLDKNDNFSFTIPIFLISAGLSLTRFAASTSQKIKDDDSARKALDVIGNLDKKEVKLLVDELRKCRNLDFIEVHGVDSHVSISIV